MYQVQYIIKPLSSMILTKISGDTNMVSTRDYIPGSTILGIIANKYIKANKLGNNAHKDEFFYRSFLNSGVIFSNAYISKKENGKNNFFYPVPFSIRYSKSKDEISDLLIERKPPAQIPGQAPPEKTTSPGAYCYISSKEMDSISPSLSIKFHQARDRLKGHSDEGTIFNYESIDPGQEFCGRIIGDENDLIVLIKLIENSRDFEIGRSKNTEYGGKAELKLINNKPIKYLSDIDDFKPMEISDTFNITLLSPMIIYNENGFPSTSINDFQLNLSQSLGISKDDIQINEVFKKTETIETFVSKWLLNKSSENAIQAGSCLKITIKGLNNLFSWEKIPGNDNVRLIEYLTQNFGIEWVKTAKIKKNDDGKTIIITSETNFLSLTLNDDKTNVNLEIDDGRTAKFIVKIEKNELKIYNNIRQSLIDLQTKGMGWRIGEGFGRFAINFQIEKKYSPKKVQNLFSWNEIPGNDNEKLVKFLREKYDIYWAKIAKIEKIDDVRTINVSTEKNSLSLKLNDEKTKVSLIIDDGRTFELNARMENSNLNIYEKTEKPVFLPELTKQILEKALIEKYFLFAEIEALKNCNLFLEYNKNLEYNRNLPANSLLGKLESMLKGSKDRNDFIQNINGLTDTTQKKLINCRNGKITLLDYLKNADVDKVFDQNVSIQECCSLISFEKDKKHIFDIYRHFWLIFLANMRKEQKNIGGN